VKIGGGLNYVTGPMGSGKSFYGVRRIVEAVTTGRYVVTNVELHEDAFERIALHVARFSATKPMRAKYAARFRSLYVFETELAEAVKYRLPGKGEARGMFVWDEAHNDLNNRSWREDGRRELLTWATQLRKLGYVGYLLSQHADNTDAALRRVCNFQVRLQNQREQTRALGFRITPWPLFLAIWLPTNTPLVSKVKPLKVERYFLDWHRHLYDTHGLYHGVAELDDDQGVIRLPEGGRAGARPAGDPAPPSPSADASLSAASDAKRSRNPLSRPASASPVRG
jgi:hypothetical protein